MNKGSADYGLHMIQLCLNLIFLTIIMSSSSYRLIIAITSLHWNYTTTCTYQSHHHTHENLLPNYLEIKVAMMPAD